MSEFIRRESGAKDIPALLAARAAGFKESPEYRAMRKYELDIPGVVCGAFAKYLCRLYLQPNVEQARESAQEALDLNASSIELADYVTDEIYENMDCTPETMKSFSEQLKPNALALYKRWSSDQGKSRPRQNS